MSMVEEQVQDVSDVVLWPRPNPLHARELICFAALDLFERIRVARSHGVPVSELKAMREKSLKAKPKHYGEPSPRPKRGYRMHDYTDSVDFADAMHVWLRSR